ncbi:MAG: YhcH/YjgK/YiaL family protein [Slackia sp.]|nr:YhcH/YjgK/YiaL family protein [Slackia sp.]
MIFGHIDTTDMNSIGHAGVRRAIEYAREHDLRALEPGRHDIDGDVLFANVCAYDTRAFEDCRFEAHRRYIDVQMVLEGAERIDVQFVGALSAEPFDEEADNMFLDGDAAASVVMTPGTFVACFPDDGHKPGIAVNGSVPVKKAVFKVLV